MTPPSTFDWIDHYPAAVTVCDRTGTIIAMNRQAMELFARRGGAGLIGTSLFDCHSPRSVAIIRDLLDTCQSNIYITESGSGRRLIQQVPWFLQDGELGGLVETSLAIQGDIPVIRRG